MSSQCQVRQAEPSHLGAHVHFSGPIKAIVQILHGRSNPTAALLFSRPIKATCVPTFPGPIKAISGAVTPPKGIQCLQ